MGKTKSNQGIKVLVAGSVLQFLLGILYVWSVFVKPVSVHFFGEAGADAHLGDIKLTSSFMICMFAVGIFICGRLQSKLGTDKITLIGGLCMAFGMLATAFVPASTSFLIYITYGIIGGFGVGMAYNSVVSAAPKWFPKKRGLVTGISVFSFGFSTVVFAPLIEWMVAQVGVQNTFLILAGVFCAATLLLFKFIVTPESVATAPIQYSGRQYSSSAMLKTPQFYLIAITMMFGTAAYFVLNPSFVTMAQGRDLAEVATYLVMFTGIANALGRLALASLSDKIGPVKASIVIYAAMAVCIGLLTFATGWLLFAAISVIVFCYGGTSGVFMLMTGEYFGGKFQGANFGVVMLSFALSALVFPLLMGGVNDVIKFSILAVLAFIGVLIFVILPAIKKKNEK